MSRGHRLPLMKTDFVAGALDSASGALALQLNSRRGSCEPWIRKSKGKNPGKELRSSSLLSGRKDHTLLSMTQGVLSNCINYPRYQRNPRLENQEAVQFLHRRVSEQSTHVAKYAACGRGGLAALPSQDATRASRLQSSRSAGQPTEGAIILKPVPLPKNRNTSSWNVLSWEEP